MISTSRTRTSAIGAAIALLLTLIPLIGAAPAGAATSISLMGHGFGHGRGMGQYGALGYALDHGRSWPQILDHFYGGTSAGTIAPGHQLRVLLQGRSGKETIVYLESGWIASSLDNTMQGGPSARKAVRVLREAEGQYHFWEGNDCGGPWTDRGSFATPEVGIFNGNANPADRNQLLQVCEETGKRYVRGDVLAAGFATATDGTVRQHTLNRVVTESYLRSVVPSESPSSWGNLGGSNGMHALRAQAVAARSYAVAGDTRWGTADTCDTIFCQVYRGHGFVSATGFTLYEAATTDLAVAETANVVRRTGGGGVARTEFSSSTGGWSAGGAFPAVVDDGDDVSANPNHTWNAALDSAAIETAFDSRAGTDLGTFQGLVVTSRNGLGAEGGRVKTVRGDFSNGSHTVSGDLFRQMFGLRSDWFTPPPPGAPPPPPPPPPPPSGSPADNKSQPAGGYVLSADGTLTAFGAAPAATEAPSLAGTARAADIAGTNGRSGYVLASNGSLHSFNGAPPRAINRELFPCDCVADIVVRPDGHTGYVLDIAGAIWEFGAAPDVTGDYVSTTTFKRIALRRDARSGYTVDAGGVLHPFGGAPPVASPALPAGRSVTGLLLRPNGSSGYVVDSAGAFLSFGGAPGIAGVGATADADARQDGTSGYVVSPSGATAPFGGAPTAAGPSGGSVRVVLIDDAAGYTLDGFGGLHAFGGAPPATISGWFPGNDKARRVGVAPNGAGWVLDAFGQLFPFTIDGVPMPPGSPSKWGFDIARDLVVLPGGGAYIVDGYGGVHAVLGAPPPRTTYYRFGFDIIRRIVLNPDGVSGFVVDGYGGFHPFAVGSAALPSVPSNIGYWPGWDIARDVAITGQNRGFTLDGFGGLHPFGGQTGFGSWYWNGRSEAKGAAGDAGRGWAVYADGFGVVHTGPSEAPAVRATDTWPGWSIARDVALAPR